MSAAEFASGPFIYRPAGRLNLAGKPSIKWSLSYDGAEIGEATVPAGAARADVAEALSARRAVWIAARRKELEPELVQLIDQKTDKAVASFYSWGVPEMSAGLIDDRNRYWLRSVDRLRSRDVTIAEYGHLVRQFAAPERAWICGLLPDEVLTHDHEEWRPPTSWEIRHIVGRDSLTGATGAQAADVVGVTPQNFRKYTAAEGAASRQKMGFAMWHTLLHRLRIQSMREG